MRCLRAISLVLALSLGASPVLAYVLSAPAILERFAARRAKMKADNQQVAGRLLLIDEAGVRTVLPALHTLRFPGDCRLEIEESGAPGAPGGAHVLVRDGKVLARISGKLELLTDFESLTCALLSIKDHGAEKIESLLKRWKIDPGYTGLSRLDDRVAYVVGARASDTAANALWFDKEKLLPVQLRVTVGEQAFELRLTGYSDPATGELHPREIQLFSGGVLRVRFVAERLEQNLDLDPKLFEG